MTAEVEVATDQLRDRVSNASARGGGKSLQQEVGDLLPKIQNALPAATGLTPVRFTRIVFNEFRKNPGIMACDRESVLGAIMQSAQLGLEFGPLGQAYMVPYKRECTFIIGYRGYIELARRSGGVKDIVAREIYEDDEFDIWYDETGDHLVHRPSRAKDRGKIIGYYGRCVYTNGGVHLEYMTPEDIEERKQRSAAGRNPDRHSPWKSDPVPMARKTVIRRMVPWLPLTTDTLAGLDADDAVVKYNRESDVIDVEHIDPEQITVTQSAGQKSAHRMTRENAALDLLGTVEDKRAKQALTSQMMEQWGPLPNLTDEQLEEVIDWLEGEVISEGEPVPPAPDPTEPPPAPDDEPPPSTSSLPQETLDSVKRAVDSWDEPTLLRIMRDWQLETRGGNVKAKRLRMFQALAQALNSDDPGVQEAANALL